MQICQEEKCTGCGMCAGLCKKKAISMKKNQEGFYYPVVNSELCVNCGSCIKQCPPNKEYLHNWKEAAFYKVNNKQDEDRIFSSSGGIFKALADDIMKSGGVAFGACFDEDFRSISYKGTHQANINELQKSKYLECNISDLYEQIEILLKQGIPVLVCGTPCHIRGVRIRLGYHKLLYLVDFLCHGVVSSSVFEKYVQSIEKKYGSQVCRIYFRDKKYGWKNSYFMRILFKNGKEYKKLSVDDPYYRLYFYGLAYRKSCYTCNICLSSLADITLGDYWGCNDATKKDGRGISIAAIHNKHGNEIFNRILSGLEVKNINLKDASYAYKERNLPLPHNRQDILQSILNEEADFFNRRNVWGNTYIDFFKEILIKTGIVAFFTKIKKRRK